MNQQRSENQVKMFDLFKFIVLLILIALLLWAWVSRPQTTPPIVKATTPPTAQPTATQVPPPTATLAPTDTPVPAPTQAPIIAPSFTLPDGATAGTVMLSGMGTAGSTVEIMLDGKSLGTAIVAADGTWEFPADIPNAGDFSLSARSIDADGSILAESDAQSLTVAAPVLSASSEEEGQAYIVQANDWLSKLADKFYDDPFAYDNIVTATNKMATTDDSFTFIDNPDLIEIGQKLWIPTLP